MKQSQLSCRSIVRILCIISIRTLSCKVCRVNSTHIGLIYKYGIIRRKFLRSLNIPPQMFKNVISKGENGRDGVSASVVVNEVKIKSSLVQNKKTWAQRKRAKKRVRFSDNDSSPVGRISFCGRFAQFFNFLWKCTSSVKNVLSEFRFTLYCLPFIILSFYRS